MKKFDSTLKFTEEELNSIKKFTASLSAYCDKFGKDSCDNCPFQNTKSECECDYISFMVELENATNGQFRLSF